jgi:hypothetical protein
VTTIRKEEREESDLVLLAGAVSVEIRRHGLGDLKSILSIECNSLELKQRFTEHRETDPIQWWSDKGALTNEIIRVSAVTAVVTFDCLRLWGYF